MGSRKVQYIQTMTLLALTCVGCSVANISGIPKTPAASPMPSQESRTDAQIITDSTGAVFVSATPKAPTATQPDYKSTERAAKMQDIGVTQTAERNAVLLAQAKAITAGVQGTDDEKNRISSNHNQDVQAGVAYAKMTQDADRATQTAVAPAQALQAADDYSQAQMAGYRAAATPTMQISIAFVCLVIAACLIGYVVSKWRRQMAAQAEEPQEADPHPELHKLGRMLIPTGPTTLDADTKPPGGTLEFSRFAEYALHGWPLGINAIEKTKLYKRVEYVPVLEWMSKKDYLAPNKGAVGLSTAGQEFCDLWLNENPLPPTQEIGPKTAPTTS